MGLLVDGVWQDHDRDIAGAGGTFARTKSTFRNWVTADGAPGPSGSGGFKAEVGRYHLYVALSCPWAHRTLIFRALKRLESAISLSIVSPQMKSGSWDFAEFPGVIADSVNHKQTMPEVYVAADARFTGRVTVPVLWDKERATIVNNESSEIIRMFNAAFDAFTDAKTDYYPAALRAEIDEINAFVYANVNNGVYRTGFATSQAAYEAAFRDVFGALDTLEERLSRQRYLVARQITEADWRLFVTLARFDAAYYGQFKCNLRRLIDYPNLSNYLRDLYQVPGVAATVDLQHIKHGYYRRRPDRNPVGLVPLGPALDFSAPHDRGRFSQ
jgi:glutathionyl-hydroquinone reductase